MQWPERLPLFSRFALLKRFMKFRNDRFISATVIIFRNSTRLICFYREFNAKQRISETALMLKSFSLKCWHGFVPDLLPAEFPDLTFYTTLYKEPKHYEKYKTTGALGMVAG
ncbi:hypothetical protein [Candidatus Methylobacter favarea]|uniref:hypothetical protein n=1 Tax=Candidatus Methylobacter favarea TaxID=2707345 RepID=UPI00157D60E3|nr:hypothetical protein [Candidatus Methylobacter favarea]